MDSKQQALERAQADHRHLLKLMTRIGDAREMSALAPLLEEFYVSLREHFEVEEDEEGLFAALVQLAPRLQVRVDDCRAEHAALLATATELRERVGECVAQKAEILAEIHNFLGQMRAHEAEEARLLAESVCTDLGVGD